MTEAEADALWELAENWGMNGEQIGSLHHDYVLQLARSAVEDGVVTDAERRDLDLVARLLSLPVNAVDRAFQAAAKMIGGSASPAVEPPAESWAGKRVCFTGELLSHHQGRPLTRERAESLATAAGLQVVDSVTKKLDLLVVADPNTQSGKAKKARQYGVRVVHEAVFWAAIGVPVE